MTSSGVYCVADWLDGLAVRCRMESGSKSEGTLGIVTVLCRFILEEEVVVGVARRRFGAWAIGISVGARVVPTPAPSIFLLEGMSMVSMQTHRLLKHVFLGAGAADADSMTAAACAGFDSEFRFHAAPGILVFSRGFNDGDRIDFEG